MGNSPSTPEEKLKRDLEERGVLIPPIFGVGSDPNWELFNPSLHTRLWQDSLSYRLLNQHLNPGIWIAAQTSSTGSVLASLVPLKSPHAKQDYEQRGNQTLSEQEGFLRVSQQLLGDKLAFKMFYHSHQSPNIATTLNLAPNCKLSSTFDAQGSGWLSAQYRGSVNNFFLPKSNASSETAYYRNAPISEDASANSNRRLQLHFGSWVDIDKLAQKKGGSKSAKSLLSSIPAAHAYASMQVPGCLLAVQGKLPTDGSKEYYEQAMLPQLSYHVSCDLTNNDNDNDGNDSTIGRPPLAVTIRKSEQSSSMALSQVITWDRYIVNALETRCPKVRNTLAWTVSLEKDGSVVATAKPRAAMAWQLNRSLAIKAVAQPDLMRGAIIFKRWRQPRITCACLVGTGKFGNLEFQGLGVTLEIGGSDQDVAKYNEAKATIVSPLVPETKATLPR